MRNIKAVAVLLVLAATSLPVMGQNLLPSSLTTPLAGNFGAAQDYMKFDGNSYPGANLICFPAGCGGEFQAHINSGTTLGNTQIPVSVWCVDYQLNVTTGSEYVADVSLLSNITHPTDTSVQYGGLTNDGTPAWNHTLAVGGIGGLAFTPSGTILSTVDGGISSTAAYRFTLAAALVSQYVSGGTPGYLDGGLPKNKAIQEAIWYLTSNSTAGTDTAFDFGTAADAHVGNSDNYAYWVNYVLTNQNNIVTTLDLTQWAVISGPVAPGAGNVVTPQNHSYQTFIAEVTPEPSFYGILGASLVGLFMARRASKRKNA